MSLRLIDAGALLVGVVLLWGVRVVVTRKRHLPPLPPGPPPKALVGNIADIPTATEWLAYAKLSAQYGPVMHLKVISRHLIIIDDDDIAIELCEKRGSIYSDRPHFVMLNDLMGWDWHMALARYGDNWRAQRAVFNQYLNKSASTNFLSLQRRKNAAMLQGVLDAPDDALFHMRRMAAANAMNAAYGIDIALKDDHYVAVAEEAMQSMNAAGLPGSYAVDWLPFLKHLPEWFPGAGFKRKAREWHKLSDAMLYVPFERTKQDMAAGKSQPCMVADVLEGKLNERFSERLVQECAAAVYLGGADTTVSTIHAFILAMVLNPEAQARAQAEIDAVVGNRLPDFSDRESLPYVGAVMLESFRQYPIIPLMVRRVMEDDVYNGMLIPQGATVIINMWSILHNARYYEEPMKFKPERFLKDGMLDGSVKDPRGPFFGYGRRICPGRHFADTEVWLAMVTVLACFRVGKVVENGVEITPTGAFRDGFLSAPLPFKFTIEPRSPSVAKLIAQAADAS